MYDQDVELPRQSRPRTINVLVLLLATAAVFSYLGAFAVTNALVSVDLMERWPAGHDPRPRWMMIGFVAMTGAFLAIGGLFRLASWRQMKRLDAIADDAN